MTLYAVNAFCWAVLFHHEIDQAAWMAPRWAVVSLSVIGGLFWWVTLLVLLVAWGREAVRRRG